MEKSGLINKIILFFCIFFTAVVCRKSGRHLRYVKYVDGKIVGGNNTTIEEVPYMAYLLIQRGNDYYECGGSIISTTYVLTAAHCLPGLNTIYVRVGSTNSNSGGTQYTTTIYSRHQLYNSRTFDYDVALVNVPGGMTLDGVNTKAVGLPARRSPIANGTNVRVTGWGDTSENGNDTTQLMEVVVPVVNQDDCRKTYSTLTARQFCAGVPEGGKDSCQGDSGGPAVSTDSELQVGIVSFGTGCARPGTPGVYTNVAAVRSWIRLISGV